MGSSLNLKRRGVVTGAGADKTIVLGYKPAQVKIVNVTDRIQNEKSDTMPDDKALRTLANGDSTYVDGVTLNSDGFTMLAAVAIADKELHYYAEESKNDA